MMYEIGLNFIFVDMSMNQIRLYDLFRKELCLPDDKAAALVKAVENVVETEASGKIDMLATKDDVHSLELKTYKAMFLTGIVELIAILGGTLAIVKLMK